jgi:hypothetical protein
MISAVQVSAIAKTTESVDIDVTMTGLSL